MGRRTSASLAVLVNGTGGHAFELDDIHKESILHAGSLATPVALALAEEAGKRQRQGPHHRDGRRLRDRPRASATRATMSLFFRGFHPQGTIRRVRRGGHRGAHARPGRRSSSSTRSASAARRPAA